MRSFVRTLGFGYYLLNCQRAFNMCHIRVTLNLKRYAANLMELILMFFARLASFWVFHVEDVENKLSK